MVLPITTQRAAHAATHLLHWAGAEDVPLERLPARSAPLPFSCSTHLANDVTDHLRRAKLGSRALEFCLYLHRQTFGNAGWHRKLGREEWWCAFDLATWAVALACNKSNLRRIRADLEACQIICFEPDPSQPGQGRIGWNLAFEAWQPYDGRRVGRARRPVMLAVNQAGVVISQQQEDAVICEQKPSDIVLEGEMHPGASGSVQQGYVVISHPGLSPSPVSKQLRQLDEKQRKITTFACVKVAQQPAQALPVRNRLREKAAETPDGVSEGQSPSPTALSGAMHQGGIPSGLASPDEPTASADTKDEETPLEGASTPQSTKQEAYWPSRQAWEQSDLDYYQRVLRERDKERVALLVRLAHERIGVPLEKASYARIGALAKQCGAALVVKHILLATANHIDGDPLDYLTRLARGQQRKETAHATRSTAPTSGYQPYTAEEASHLVWNTL